jgi:hypothetical protein
VCLARSAVLSLVVVCAGACGGSTSGKVTPATGATSTSTTATGVEAAFQTKAVAACKAASDQLRAQGRFPFPDFDPVQPDTSKFPTIAAYEAKTVTNDQEFQRSLVGLGQPTMGQSAWDTFLNVVDRFVRLSVAQQDAAQRNDPATFTRTYRDLVAQAGGAKATAAAAGVPSCDPYSLQT